MVGERVSSMNAIRYVGIIALIGLVTPVFARIGETEDQLLKRFGEPTSRSRQIHRAQGRSYDLGPTLDFKQEDWRISCDLIDGRCARIVYVKTNQWTEAHFQTVLNANTQGGTWTEMSKPGITAMLRQWKRSDGGVARWSIGSMTITVPAYERAVAVAEAKAKAAAGKPAKI